MPARRVLPWWIWWTLPLCAYTHATGASNARCTHSRGRSDRPQPSGSLHFKRGKNFWMPHAPQTRRELALPSTIVHPRPAPISSIFSSVARDTGELCHELIAGSSLSRMPCKQMGTLGGAPLQSTRGTSGARARTSNRMCNTEWPNSRQSRRCSVQTPRGASLFRNRQPWLVPPSSGLFDGMRTFHNLARPRMRIPTLGSLPERPQST